MREARIKGVPHIGSGAIYPIPDSDIECDPFPIPKEWPMAWGGDFSKVWNAIVWGAWDRDNDVLYLTREYKTQTGTLNDHAQAVRSAGIWIPGVADAADLRSDEDRRRYIDILRDDHGLNLELPDKAVETGIQQVYSRMISGRLKVFKTCQKWFQEKRMYRRGALSASGAPGDDDRKMAEIVKKNDHLMDSTRYLVRSGLARAKSKAASVTTINPAPIPSGYGKLGWMR